MVNLKQLSELNAKRPFAPYWVRLASGETVHVTAPFTAIVTEKRFFFTRDRRLMHFVPIDEVEAHGPLPSTGDIDSTGGNSR